MSITQSSTWCPVRIALIVVLFFVVKVTLSFLTSHFSIVSMRAVVKALFLSLHYFNKSYTQLFLYKCLFIYLFLIVIILIFFINLYITQQIYVVASNKAFFKISHSHYYCKSCRVVINLQIQNLLQSGMSGLSQEEKADRQEHTPCVRLGRSPYLVAFEAQLAYQLSWESSSVNSTKMS